jgi:amidase
MFVADGGKSVEALLAPTNEPIRPEMQAYKDAEELGVHAMWQLHLERSELQKKMLDLWMSYEGLDAILCEPNRQLNIDQSNLAQRLLLPSLLLRIQASTM